MGIERLEAEAVVDNHDVAVDAEKVCVDYFAVVASGNRSMLEAGEIKTRWV